MDGFSSYFQSSEQPGYGNSWSYDTFKNVRNFSPAIRSHLKRVYLTLCCALVSAAVGSYLDILWNVGGLLTMLACLGCMTWLLATPPYEERKRLGLLMAAAVFQGASILPLIGSTVDVDPSLLVSAFVGCAIAFGCFSAAAMLARRQEYLWLGALCSSGLSVLLWLSLASALFGGFTSLYMFEIYFGLLVFVGYIVYDTQAIIEKAHLGDRDYVKHAMTLFTDFVNVFVRILTIVLKNAMEKKDEKKKKKRSN